MHTLREVDLFAILTSSSGELVLILLKIYIAEQQTRNLAREILTNLFGAPGPQFGAFGVAQSFSFYFSPITLVPVVPFWSSVKNLWESSNRKFGRKHIFFWETEETGVTGSGVF